jgi:hypothetical protein
VVAAPQGDGHLLFESEATWKILADGPRRVIVDHAPVGLYSAVHLQPGSNTVLVECSPALVSASGALVCPVRYPLDQLLAMYLLGERGLLLHAAGMRVGGRAVVLPGVSGAGKSTFSRLAAGRPGWEPLSDDRVLVALPDRSDGATAHGTPWPGEGRIAANLAGPLAGVVFLTKGSANEIRPLTTAAAMPRLLATASLPWFDRDYLPAGLAACERLLSRVPAAELTFRPDDGAVEAVERLLEST